MRNAFSLVTQNRQLLLGWASRLGGIALSLLFVPLAIQLLQPSGYAAYLTLSSLGTWFSLLSLGLPATLQVSLSRLRNKQVATLKIIGLYNGTIVCILTLALPLVIAVSLLLHNFLFRAVDRVDFSTVLVQCICLTLVGISQLFINTQYGLHRPFWPNLYPSLASFIVYVCVFALLAIGKPSIDINISLQILFLCSIPIPIHAFILSKAYKNVRINWRVAIVLINRSKHYLIFGLLSACTLAVDYLIMSIVLSPNEIIQYSIATRSFMGLLAFFQIVILNKWSSLSDLMHSKNIRQTKRLVRSILIKSLSFVAILGFVIILFFPRILSLLGAGRIAPVGLFLPLMALLYILIRVWVDTFAAGLLSFGNAKEINKIVFLQALLSILLQWFFGKHLGPSGILIGIILSFLFTVFWSLPFKFYGLLSKL